MAPTHPMRRSGTISSACCNCRQIKNKALSYLSMLKEENVTSDILGRFRGASNMTDSISMLATLADSPGKVLVMCCG